MLEPAPTVRLVLTTEANPEKAANIGRTLLEERLAACVTLLPAAQSIYWWQGKIESVSETILLLKTEVDRLEALEARLKEIHSYETPEFLVLQVDSGSQAYLAWLHACLHESA
jgi:periplasmic divalent cation tolerance protein